MLTACSSGSEVSTANSITDRSEAEMASTTENAGTRIPMVIEGYQVFTEDGVEVKQESVDSGNPDSVSTEMANSLCYQHGTRNEYNSLFCDICFETKGHIIKVYGYCKDCLQFLCADCHVFHKHVHGTRNHTILQGMDMPQSRVEKPAQFEICDVHSKQVKDQFCSNHNILLCSLCSSEHKDCSVLSVDDTCKSIRSDEINELYNHLNKYKQALDKTESSIIKNIDTLREDSTNMFKEAQTIHDQIVLKAGELLHRLKTTIEEKVKTEISVLQNCLKQIQDSIVNFNSTLSEIMQLKGKKINSKVFLKVHDILSFTKKGNVLTDSIPTVSLSMEPSQTMKDFLSSFTTMVSVFKTQSNNNSGVILPEIKFPGLATGSIHSVMLSVESSQKVNDFLSPAFKMESASTIESMSSAAVTEQDIKYPALAMEVHSEKPSSVSAIAATKISKYNEQQKDDKKERFITGLVIMKNGNLVLVDHFNSRLKMKTKTEIVSYLPLPDKPRGISVMSDSEVVVCTDNSALVIVSIFNTLMSITKSCTLSFRITGITKCKDKYVVTSVDPRPASVKLIDLAGNVYWSLSHDQGQLLFNNPCYLYHHPCSSSSTVIITDFKDNSLTLVDGETGKVKTMRSLQLKYPLGVTADNEGYIYVCYNGTDQVAVLNRDLSEERILLSKQDGMSSYPQAIAYDSTGHQLFISYSNYSSHGIQNRCNSIDCYQLK